MDDLESSEDETETITDDEMDVGAGADEDGKRKIPSIVLPQLLENERKFLEIVGRDDVKRVEQFLWDNPKFNINCVNFQGISALHVAIKKNSSEMVKCLLSKPKIDVFDCHLHAIEQNQVEIVELLLNSLRNERNPQTNRSREYDGCFNSSDFPDFMTPLLLAASSGHYELVQMLLSRGHRIEKPHSPFCKCTKCKNQLENDDILNMTRMRLSFYKGVINPAYISSSSTDPILTSFQLANDLKQRSIIEPNFRSEYLTMANETRQFAVDLIDCCRNADEVQIVLRQRTGMKSSLTFSYPRLLLAMDLKQKEFVAHSNTQQIVQLIWCENWFKWMTMTKIEKIARFLLRFFLIPVIVCNYLLRPKSRLAQKWRSPVNKFISHVTSYFVFLALLLRKSLQDKRKQTKLKLNSGVEFWIYLYVFSHVWNSVRMCIVQGPNRFFHNMWNWYDFAMTSLFTLTLILWSCQHFDANDLNLERKYWNDFDSVLVAESAFTIATIMAFLKLLFLCGLDYYLGPLQIALGKMSVDIAKYFTIFITIIFSFSAGLAHFYQYYDGMVYEDGSGTKTTQYASFVSFAKTLKTLFWALFCMSPVEAADIVIENDRNATATNTHILTETVGYILFGVFEIMTVFIIINMLIATMANTFQRVIDNVDIEWTFGRTQVQVEYMLQTTLPPPFNMLPTWDGWQDAKNWYQRIFRKKRRNFARKTKLKADYVKLMSNLMQRYFATNDAPDSDKIEIGSIR